LPIQQGIQQGECAVLLRQLRQRFGDAVDEGEAVGELERLELGVVAHAGRWRRRRRWTRVRRFYPR
jgi:hypothetical protein